VPGFHIAGIGGAMRKPSSVDSDEKMGTAREESEVGAWTRIYSPGAGTSSGGQISRPPSSRYVSANCPSLIFIEEMLTRFEGGDKRVIILKTI
jgi:hypothetical protein